MEKTIKQIERVEIEFGASERQKVLDWLWDNGYHQTVYLGPKKTETVGFRRVGSCLSARENATHKGRAQGRQNEITRRDRKRIYG